MYYYICCIVVVVNLFKAFTQSASHSFTHSFRQSQNTRAIKMQFAWNVLNICLTLPTTGGIGRAGGAGQTAGHTPTALGTQIEPLKSHRSFTIAKYSAANAHKQPYSTFLLQAGQAVAGGGVATPTSVHSECSQLPPPCLLPLPIPAFTPIAHTPRCPAASACDLLSSCLCQGCLCCLFLWFAH